MARRNRFWQNAQRDFWNFFWKLGGFGLLMWLALCGTGSGQIIQTVAGGYIGDGGPALQASLAAPSDVFQDGAGNTYIADRLNRRVRKVDAATGTVTTVAGGGSTNPYFTGSLVATEASLSDPSSIFVDGSGNLFLTDSGLVLKVDTGGTMTVVAGGGPYDPVAIGDGGPATEAVLNQVGGVFVDGSGNVYIADSGHQRVRKVDAATGTITTVAGNGTAAYSGDGGAATAASLNWPQGVWVDGAGNLFIADRNNQRVRKVDAAGTITTVAGNGTTSPLGDGGPATSAAVSQPWDVFVDASTGDLYIAEWGGNRIRKVSGGVISTVAGGGQTAGDGGQATDAALGNPQGVYVDASGDIFFADSNNNRVRKVDASGVLSTVAGGSIGDGNPATQASLWLQEWNQTFFLDAAGNLYIPDTDHNRVREVDAATGIITTVAGNGTQYPANDGGPATDAGLYQPSSVCMDGSGNLYIGTVNGRRVRKVDMSTGIITTVAGGGQATGDGGLATDASLGIVLGLSVDAGNNLYLATGNQRVRKVDLSTGIITTVAGNGTVGFSGDGGPATDANLNGPSAISVGSGGDLYIADSNNHRVRKVDGSTGIITTVAGGGSPGGPNYGDGGQATDAALGQPFGVFVDAAGNLYIGGNNSRVRRVDAGTGVITTVAGSSLGFSGDGGLATDAKLNGPTGVFLAGSGELYIADSGNNRIRKVLPPAWVLGLSATPTGLTAGGLPTVLQAEIRDRNGVLQTGDNSTVVTFAVAGGTGSLSETSATASGGVATTELSSGTVGSVTVQASAYDAEGASVSVPVSAPTRQLSVTANPAVILDDGSIASTVEAQVQDLSGALQDTDSTTVVSFRIVSNPVTGGGGSLSAGSGTASGGIATVTLTGTSAGILSVEAGADGAAKASVTVTVKSSSPGSGGGPGPISAGPGEIATIAGGYIGDGGPALAANLRRPGDVCKDGAGNLYIADTENNRVRLIDPSGTISTYAGGGSAGYPDYGDGGLATAASLSRPTGVCLDGAGDLYISDGGNGRVRMVSPAGIISTVAGGGTYGNVGDGGPATSAYLNYPQGVFVTAGALYISEPNGYRVRKVDLGTGTISTVAGTGVSGSSGDGGPATAATLQYPRSVFVDGAGNLYIADATANRVRVVDASGTISTFAGGGSAGWPDFGDGGPATDATLTQPAGLWGDASGAIYIADSGYNRIRKVDSGGTISTVAGGVYGFSGDGGPAVGAGLYQPQGIFVDGAGVLYIADSGNGRIRKVEAGTISTIAGGNIGDGGPALLASLNNPYGIAVDAADNLYIADWQNGRVRRVDPSGQMTTVAGGGSAGYPGFGDGGAATDATLSGPTDVAVDSSGNLFIVDAWMQRVRKVDALTGTISTVAGNGVNGFSGDGGAATDADLYSPEDVCLDASGNLYIADMQNNRVRKVDAATGVITTVAGSGGTGYGAGGFSGDGGPATAAQLNQPAGVAADGAGNLYISDTRNNRVRKVDVGTGIITTVAGGGPTQWPDHGDGGPATDADLNFPRGICLDSAGNLYIAGMNSSRIRKVTPSGTISTVAGNGSYGFAGDGGLATDAQLAQPSDVFIHQGFLYLADSQNQRIRWVNLEAPPVPTPTGSGVAVQPVDETGSTSTTLTFSNVTQAGETSITTDDSGLPPPSGFQVGDTPVYFDLTTTAVFSGSVEICYDYSSAGIVNDSNLKLFHFVNNAWTDVTTSLDTVNDILCGNVTSLSPFAIFQATAPPVAALTGTGGVEVGKGLALKGDIFSNGNVKLKKGDKDRAGLVDGSITAGGDVEIEADNRVTGDVKAGGEIRLKGEVTVEGDTTAQATVKPLALPPVLLTVDPEKAPKVQVKGASGTDLPPNGAANPAYGDLEVEHGAPVTLHSGTYYFRKLHLGHDAVLVFLLDPGAPVTVNVLEDLKVEHNAQVRVEGGDASQVLFNVAGKGQVAPDEKDAGDGADAEASEVLKGFPKMATIEHDAVFRGTVYAPLGTVQVQHDAKVEGAVVAGAVKVEDRVDFTGVVAAHLDLSGSTVLAKPGLAAAEEEAGFGLDQNYPNPFNPSTTIRYTLPGPSEVRLVIYNVLGQEVRVLVNALQAPGAYRVVWDGRDAFGRGVSSGVYFYRLHAGSQVAMRRMLLIK